MLVVGAGSRLISGEVGLRKPDPAIFAKSVDLLSVPADRCLFVDDMLVNIEAAQRLGMAGMLHTSPDETKTALHSRLDIPEHSVGSVGTKRRP